MKKIIEKFIVWYLLKQHNAKFEDENYVVRVFSKNYYDILMLYASTIDSVNCRCSPVIIDPSGKVVQE